MYFVPFYSFLFPRIISCCLSKCPLDLFTGAHYIFFSFSFSPSPVQTINFTFTNVRVFCKQVLTTAPTRNGGYTADKATTVTFQWRPKCVPDTVRITLLRTIRVQSKYKRFIFIMFSRNSRDYSSVVLANSIRFTLLPH